MPHTLPDYIAGKIKKPRAFSPGLKMPQYTFTPQQIDALTTALLSLNERAYSCLLRSRYQAESEIGLPAGGESWKIDSRSRLLQLPSHQWAWRRYGSRPYMGRQFGAARLACAVL